MTYIRFYTGVMLFVLIGCRDHTTNQVKDWTGGKITRPGTYQLPDSALRIDVYLENNFVRYKAFDILNNVVIQYGVDINMYQNWAFYLDELGNFWVLSSDVGHSVWRKSKGKGAYYQYIFNHIPTKAEVPESLYSHCREFFYGN